MKELKKNEVQYDGNYLVFTGYDWSPSGFDLARADENGHLISQSNGENLNKAVSLIKIYELPDAD